MSDKLSPKQSRFIKEYMANGFNGKVAAITAGYSKHTAEVQASKMLRIPKLAKALEKAKARLEAKQDFSRDRLMNLVLEQALYDGEGATHGARVSALGLLGKWTGLDIVKVEQDTNVSFKWLTDGDGATVIEGKTE